MFSTTLNTCVSRQGRRLSPYPNHASAEQGALLALLKYKSRMVPYRCTHCSSWHLTPANRHTPCHYCESCGKQAYESEVCAERRARLLEQEKRTWLRVYECPHGDGWHLTSRL